MTQESREQLLVAIREDDVKAFTSVVDSEVLSSTFGRFPLLSLLYLFQAKRIVKAYLSDLLKERPRVKEPSFREADKLFLQKGGKALRYFTEREVSPLEMLAVLGERTQLQKLYALYPRAERYLPSIKRIYFTRLGKEVTMGQKGELLLPKEPLPFLLRKRLILFIALFLSLFLVFGGVTIFTFAFWGSGSETSPYKVRSEKLLVASLESGKYVSLQKDLGFSETLTDYASALDGEEHIVRLHAPFAETLTGEIRNVIFVLEEDFVGDAVILENQGTLKNVRIVAEGYALQVEKEKEFIGLLTTANKGVIDGCTAVISVDITGTSGKDCSIAPFAGINEGRVQNCRTDGSIKGEVTDVAGVVAVNRKDGVVTDCVGIVDLVAGTSVEGWSPNAAGVVLQNEGTIYGCTVKGSVTAELAIGDPDGATDTAEAHAAGITCKNTGSVKNCVNESNVTAKANKGVCFAGGIVSLNGIILYEIVEAETYTGEIVKKTQEKEIFIGIVQECTSKGETSATSDKNNTYAGGIVSYNEKKSTVTLSKGSGKVTSEAPGNLYDVAGGIVGNNHGTVTKSLFLGTLATHDEDSLNGTICGVTVLNGEPYFSGYWVSAADNTDLSGALHAFGGLSVIEETEVSNTERFYPAAYLEKGSDARLLDLGVTSYETAEEALAAFETIAKGEEGKIDG